jgi:hypothetical protein
VTDKIFDFLCGSRFLTWIFFIIGGGSSDLVGVDGCSEDSEVGITREEPDAGVEIASIISLPLSVRGVVYPSWLVLSSEESLWRTE